MTLITRRTLLRSSALTAGTLALRPSFALEPVPVQPSFQLSCESLIEPLGLQEPRPRLNWTAGASTGALRQQAYQVQVASTPDGPADLWDSGRVVSPDVAVLYGGTPVLPHSAAYWRVRTWTGDIVSPWSSQGRWSAGPATEQDWAGSHWIGRDDLLESTQEQMPGATGIPPEPNFYPAPYLRKQFDARGGVRCAFLYASGLGYAELHLNGHKLGERTERDPGFTNFNHRVLYVTHDVTPLLQAGANVIGAILGTGWYDVHDVATWHFNTASWRQRPRLRLTLAIAYADGSKAYVTSDDTWRCGSGPILRDGIYTGEVYDARLEQAGWATTGFDDSHWTPALVVEPPTGKLVPLSCEPVRRRAETIVPVSVTEAKPGVFIVNMGQNFAGHTQLRVQGPAGHAITLRYAEILNPDGTLNSLPIGHFMEQTKPAQPFQQDTYICKGSAQTEVWEQRFSYSGFQYVEVTHFPGVPTVDNFRGVFAYTDLAAAGEFTCSHDVANKIQRATRQSYYSNAQSYPTDCPQREKNGWTGDAGMAAECGLMNFHSAAFYCKWLDDFADAQRPDGGLPVLVPNGGWGNGERWPGEVCPPWDAAYPIIAWQVYRFTGDLRVLARHIEPLRRYVAFFLKHRRPNGLCPALGIGDWSPFKTVTPEDYITNAYLYMDLDLMAKMCAALGTMQEAQRYRTLADETAASLHRHFYDSVTHRYSNGSQMAQGTALYFGFVPDAERAAVFHHLVAQVEQLGHLDVGFLGAKHVLRALAEGGRVDLAFKVATQPAMPSYGYWIASGSTTLWEGWKAGQSHNHIMFGDISAWFYHWIAGLQQTSTSVAFSEILLRPTPVEGVTDASATYTSPHGPIAVSWKMAGSCMSIAMEIPTGSSARLSLPAGAHFAPSCVLGGRAKQRAATETERLFPPGKHVVQATFA